MFVKVWRFVTLMLTALSLGMAFGHLEPGDPCEEKSLTEEARR